MTTSDAAPDYPKLDPNVLDGIASVMCGDDTTLYYRSTRDLEKVFDAAGWHWVGSCTGGRRWWVVEELNRPRVDGAAMQRLLTRLVDSREYLDDDSARVAALSDLNALLVHEGYELFYDDDNSPRLRARSRRFQRPESEIPVELTADLGGLVQDAVFGDLLKRRLDEAHICWSHGAHLAAVILLGSLLEGVLLDVARNRHDPLVRDNLANLITLASKEGWLAKDVADYADVLRNHRNLVHPNKQHKDGHIPDGDTVRIAWNVVVAAINDLAAGRTTNTDEAA